MLRRIATRIRLIRIHRVYTTKTLADLLKVHVQTVRSWLKVGLRPVDPNDKPTRVVGADAKSFLQGARMHKRTRLLPRQFYCSRCRAPRESLPSALGFSPYRREIASGKYFVIRIGMCSVCGCRLRRFAVEDVHSADESTCTLKGAHSRLTNSPPSHSNTNIEENRK